MTKEQILLNVIFPIVVSVLTVVIGTYFAIYARDKDITLNKINTTIKRIIYAFFKYFLPVSVLIITFFISDVDKLFVLRVSLLLSYLVFISLFDLINKLVFRHEYSFRKTVDALITMSLCDQCICDYIKKNNPDFICTVKKSDQKSSS